MSKTSQRKNSYYQQGIDDFYIYVRPYPPMVSKNHPINREYMRGYRFAERNHKLKTNSSLLQWFRVKFAMVTA